jgi:Flp pilus assembly protein CpaB
MKWSVIALIVLGVIAAFCASLLMGVLRADKADEQVTAVVAAGDLPAMSVILLRHVEVKKVPGEGLSRDYCSEPIQVIGRVLSVPVVSGQVLTRNLLISEGSGAQLAATLPYGMRAVSVPVANYSVMSGLLYPGCLVDVIATFKLRSRGAEKGQAISKTLLHNVRVLAVQDDSIVSGNSREKENGGGFRGRSYSSEQTVTLMVDTKQAEALQLAMDNGKITLAMRNPLDGGPVDIEPTVLSDGRLAKYGDLLGTSAFVSRVYADTEGAGLAGGPSRPVRAAQIEDIDQLGQLLGYESDSQSRLQWEVTVIRGNQVSEEILEIDEDQ